MAFFNIKRLKAFTQSPQSTFCQHLITSPISPKDAKHQISLHYLQKMRSIKYLYIISNRSEASNISTLSPKDAKHQIPLHYLQQKRSIKYLYIISNRSEASNISTLSPKDAKASNISTLSLTDAKASKTSTLSPTEAKHQISPHYLQQKRSIKYLYIISNRC